MDATHRHPEPMIREPLDPDALCRRIHRRGTAIKRREVETATRRLDADDGFTETQRAIVTEMADRITADLLAAPTAALEDADRDADSDELVALARLFTPPDDVEE